MFNTLQNKGVKMKLLHLYVIIFTAAFSGFCCAEQENSESQIAEIQEIEVKELNFEELPDESLIGDLSEVVKEKESFADLFLERVRRTESRAIMHPYAEGVSYVNGQLCHVGNYPQSVIYTVLEGPYYGTQTTMTYDGIVLYVNYEYHIEYTFGGTILTHYYSDSKIITGSNQIIKFY